MVCLNFDEFSDHIFCESEHLPFLSFQVTSCNHMLKGLYTFVGGSLSQ